MPKLFSLEDDIWLEGKTISTHALNHSHKFKVHIMNVVSLPGIATKEVLMTVAFVTTSELATLLIHVVDILQWDVMVIEYCLEFVKIISYSGIIERPCPLWI
jgi:radical SAM superfamily enzyme